MSKNIIFCFSGSGNCLDIAMNIAVNLGNTDIVLMRKEPTVTSTAGYSTVGFVFPCHGGGMPIGLEDKIKKISIDYSTYTWACVSYSGYMGYGLKKLDNIHPLNYWDGISHHCSCIWLLPHNVMIPPLNIEKANKRSSKLAKKIAENVLNRTEKDKAVPSPLANRAEQLAWPMLAKKKASTFDVSDKCTSCGLCVNLCPKDNISCDENGKIKIGNNCMQCLSCVQYCPNHAISISGSKDDATYHNPNIKAELLTRAVIHID